MEFLNEGVEETVVNYKVDMNDQERMVLFEHARDKISEEEFEEMMINWAMVDILTKEVEKTLNTLPEEDK